jgi:hypothetical protein
VEAHLCPDFRPLPKARRWACPWENGYNESFNGKLRDELLNGACKAEGIDYSSRRTCSARGRR